MRSAVKVLVLGCALTSALAEAPVWANDATCAGFSWSVDQEMSWFKAQDSVAATTGATLPQAPSKAITLALKPTGEVSFPAKPAVKQQALGPNSFSGWFTISGLGTPGLYQISISANAWIDVLQNSEVLTSTAFTGMHDCPTLRKSVRFDLKSAPVTIQIAGAPAPTIAVAIRKAD